jgi:hypothetical protein
VIYGNKFTLLGVNLAVTERLHFMLRLLGL